MMITHLHMVIAHLHLSPKAELWQESLAQSSPEDRHCLVDYLLGSEYVTDFIEASQHYYDIHSPEGKSKAPGK